MKPTFLKSWRPLTLCAIAAATLLAFVGHPFLAVLGLFTFEAAIKVGPVPYCGNNSLGTLATATIVQEALDLVFTVRPILNSISTGFTDKNGSPVAQFNQQVITRTKAIPTVVDFGGALSNRADVDVPVTLDQFKEVAYEYTPQEYSGTNRDLVREAALPMATALANHMVDAIASLWTFGNYPIRTGADAVANGATNTKTVKAAGWDYTHLTGVRATLNKAGVPVAGRFYIGNSDVYQSLLTDLRIVAALNNPQNSNAIQSGKLPVVAGLALDEFPNLPTTGNLVGFSGTPDSTVFAARVPRDPRELIPGLVVPGNMGIVTEPKTGLSVMVLEYLTMSTLKITTKLVWMYGKAVGNPNNGQLVVTN
jgi:hypothetical protein